MESKNFYNRGESAIGIIIIFVIASLITSGLYLYFDRQLPKVSKVIKNPTRKEFIKPKELVEEKLFLPPEKTPYGERQEISPIKTQTPTPILTPAPIPTSAFRPLAPVVLPSVDIKVDGTDGPITADTNTNHTLSWQVGGNPKSCIAEGSWRGIKPTNGQESIVVPSNLSGALGYWLNCDGARDHIILQITDKSYSIQPPTTPPPATPPIPASTLEIIVSALASDIYTIQDDGSLFSGRSINPQNIARSFYQKYPDDVYDFLAVYTLNGLSYYATTVKNQGLGFGSSIVDNTAIFGSKGRLLGVGTIGNFEQLFFTSSVAIGMAHEIAHHWLIYIGDSHECSKINSCRGKLRIRADDAIDYGHWSLFVDGTVDIDGIQHAGMMKTNAWKKNSDDTFSLRPINQSETDNPLFSDTELYLMGLVPQSEAHSPLVYVDTQTSEDVLRNSWCCIPESERRVSGTLKQITVSDIIQMEGVRTPTYLSTQKDFRVAQIFIIRKGQTLSLQSRQRLLELQNLLPQKWFELTKGHSTINR